MWRIITGIIKIQRINKKITFHLVNSFSLKTFQQRTSYDQDPLIVI